MNITKMRFYFFDRFSIQCNDQMQHTMSSRMLWSYIDDHITKSHPGAQPVISVMVAF